MARVALFVICLQVASTGTVFADYVEHGELTTNQPGYVEPPPDFRPVYDREIFTSCSPENLALGNGTPTSPASQEISNNLQKELFSKLLTKVKDRTQENLDFATEVRDCFTQQVLKNSSTDERAYCSQIREWVNPKQFSLNGTPADPSAPTTVQQSIDLARFNLALAPAGDSPEEILGLNTKLGDGGFKEKPWEPLDSDETAVYKNELETIQEIVFEKLKAEKKLSTFKDLKAMKAYILEGKRPASAGNTRSAVRLRGRAKQLFLNSVKEVRQGYLGDYRKQVENLTLLNFISSRNPIENEIQKAAAQIAPNAEKELSKVVELDDAFESIDASLATRPKTRISFHRLKPLLQYRGLLEDVVAENPKLCGVATYALQRQQKIKTFRKRIVFGSLMAASILLPPLGQALAIGALTVGSIPSNYVEYKTAGTASLAAITNYDRGLRRDRSDATDAKEELREDVQNAALVFATGGGALQGWRTINGLRKGITSKGRSALKK